MPSNLPVAGLGIGMAGLRRWHRMPRHQRGYRIHRRDSAGRRKRAGQSRAAARGGIDAEVAIGYP